MFTVRPMPREIEQGSILGRGEILINTIYCLLT